MWHITNARLAVRRRRRRRQYQLQVCVNIKNIIIIVTKRFIDFGS